MFSDLKFKQMHYGENTSSTQYPNEPLKVNALIDDAVKRNGPNFIRKYGPAAAATMAVSGFGT